MDRSAADSTSDGQVRRARPDDLSAVVGLWLELIDFHFAIDPYYRLKPNAAELAAEFLGTRIESENSLVLVADVDGSVIGYLMAEVASRPHVFEGDSVLLIMDACVTSGCRRRGVGKALVDELLRVARELGITRIEVGYNVKNETSTAFWREMGFKPFSAKSSMELT